MSAKLTIAISLAAGLLGGLLSHYLPPLAVHAQTAAPVPREVRAQSFVLVNERGAAVGLFGFDPQGNPVVRLLDEQGRVLWSAGTSRLTPATQ